MSWSVKSTLNLLKKGTLLILFFICTQHVKGQTSVIKGSVTDATNNESIPFANVFVEQINARIYHLFFLPLESLITS